MAVARGTDSDKDSYKRKEREKLRRRIINHQIVYESSRVNEQNRKYHKSEMERDAVGIWQISGNGAKGSRW